MLAQLEPSAICFIVRELEDRFSGGMTVITEVKPARAKSIAIDATAGAVSGRSR